MFVFILVGKKCYLICIIFQRRVTTRRYKYFYNPIEGTPFSLGLAIPEGYGMYEVLGEQEIKHSHINGKYLFYKILLKKLATFKIMTAFVEYYLFTLKY